MTDLDIILERIITSTSRLADILAIDQPQARLGLRRAARLALLAAQYKATPRPILLITDRTDRGLILMDELGLWLPDSPRLFLPEPNPLFYEPAPWGGTTRRDRLSVLTLLARAHIPGAQIGTPPIIIAPARAIMTRTLPRREFLAALQTIKPTQVVRPDDLVRQWIHLGYEPVNTVVSPGQYARRGGIADIWPPAEYQPARIEFFGDEIETLRTFDPATQRTIHPLDHLRITPSREYLLKELEPGLTGPDLPISEFHIPLLHPLAGSVLDYLPRQAMVLIDDADAVRDIVLEIEEQSIGQRQDYIADGLLPVDFPLPYLSWSEIEDTLSGKTVLDLGPSGNHDELDIHLYFSAGPRFGGRLKQLIDMLVEQSRDGEQVILVSRQVGRLKELWGELYDRNQDIPVTPRFMEGSLGEGFSFRPVDGRAIHLLTDGEIFGWRRPEPRQRTRPGAESPEAAYADLQTGDWVVHVDHGIGRFIDLVTRTVDGVEREYLCVEYAEGDQLFVPVYQADRLTRYVGPDSRSPTPTRLGSLEWRGAKTRVKEAVEEVADELLDLYAKRVVVQGYSYPIDTPWQHELEASFPYVETDDQIRVIDEVKRDMQSPRPMDRLICGDVGYGKTEVALRAAFKAVMDGKQVAILVPTTVLAQQHFHTFRDRLSAFPVEVEMLSRFRTPQQQREILSHLAQGAIDIIIGTHRLLQNDVKFKDLGLLVIDEEQRFGVTHKETLKKLRTEVDVLTLTATPIPRTLYMTLTGVRDISTINTPPEERLPIITHVGPYSPRLVRQAILREMERGGQIFFVHNRVQTIDAMRLHLEKMVPGARLAVAHGQMPEHELSERMELFTEGEVDILLSTSIIESGLDIPNANTLIVDRADTFGLAQLYQLRGRVGRGAQRAYAYFFRHRRRPPTSEGRQRLETIAENTQLGAGFSIAMRDLEIRGAGDLLGTRQHGHIAAVGFHLYTRLLADAIRRLRSSSPLPAQQPGSPFSAYDSPLGNPVNVDLVMPVGIPAEYIADREARLRLYRRIANVRSLTELEALMDEFVDRFGVPPEPVRNLLFQLKIKLLAEHAGAVSVNGEGGQIVVRFAALPEGINSRFFPDLGSEIRSGKNTLWLQSSQGWEERLENALRLIAGKSPEIIHPG